MFALLHNRISLNRFTLALILIFSTLGALFWVVGPAYAADCQAQYTVQRGDNLYRIGLKYNMTWDRITGANNITNPDKIYTGQVLCIPVSNEPSSEDTTALPTNVQYVKALTDVYIRVGPGTKYDTMGKVKMGQVIKVTGVSSSGSWWRVICPDNTTGNCWITAGAKFTQPTTSSGTSPTPLPNPVVIPVFTILAVVHDQSVTIQTADFPAGMKFKVLMGSYGSAGVNGYYVTTTNSGTGGSFKATYTIPEALQGSKRIAIRLEGTSGYYSYNWFWNDTTK